MPPDYSQFQSAQACACKIEQHYHSNGEIHLTIELLMGPGTEQFAEAVCRGFDQMMKQVAGSDAISEERWSGPEAHLHDRSIEEYYAETQECDSKKCN